MPIDFAAIADLYKERMKLETRRASLAQAAIGGPLGRRLSAAKSVEGATKQFPIIRFYNGAPVMKITASQLGSLAVVVPPQSVSQGFVQGALGFAGGFAQIWAPLKGDSQETVLKRFTMSFDAALKEIEASLKRFEKPTPEMFDPRKSKASDVFGLAGLAFRALDEASKPAGEIEVLTSQIARARGIIELGPPPSTNDDLKPTIPVEEAPARSLSELLDSAAFTLLGGIVILGTLPFIVDLLFKGVLIRAKVWILDEFTAIERHVLDFRKDMIQRSFQGVTDWANGAIDLLGGIHAVVGVNLEFMLKFWRAFGTQFGSSVRDFVIKLVDYFRDWIRLLNAIPDLLAAVTAFDLTLLLRDKLGGIVDYVPSLGLDELLDSAGDKVNLAKYIEWMNVLDAAEAVLIAGTGVWGFLTGAIGLFLARKKIAYGFRQIGRTRRLMNALFPGLSWGPFGLMPIGIIPKAHFLEEAPPLEFKSQFPNLYETLMGGGRAARFIAIIDGLQHSVDFNLTEAMRQARNGLGELSTVFSEAAAEAARFRGDRRLLRAADSANELADKVFGPEVKREREGVANRKADPLALAFEKWLATGGFQLIGAVIPVYVREMAQYWRRQVEAGEELTAPLTPTSPHILRKRAVLGKVVVPRITLHSAPRECLDEPLVEFMADGFVQAVERAFSRGQTRLAEMAAVGPP